MLMLMLGWNCDDAGRSGKRKKKSRRRRKKEFKI